MRAKGWNKYSAVKTEIDGHVFASKAEAADYWDLKMRRLAGEITHLELQPKFDLIVLGLLVGTYTADFSYWEGKCFIVHERKGVKARDFALRSRLFMALFPNIELRVNGVKAKRPKPPAQQARAAA